MPRDDRFLTDLMVRAAERRERARSLDADLDWRSWIRLRLAAYWYWFLVLFLDIGVVATILSLAGRPASAVAYVASFAFLVPAIYLEWEGYRFLWPPDEEILEREARRSEPAPATTSASTAERDRET